MPSKKRSGNKKGKQSNFAKLSIFQPNKYKFKKSCPLSLKEHQMLIIKILDYLKNICLKMVKFYLQELQMFVKKNKENYPCQLKELET